MFIWCILFSYSSHRKNHIFTQVWRFWYVKLFLASLPTEWSNFVISSSYILCLLILRMYLYVQQSVRRSPLDQMRELQFISPRNPGQRTTSSMRFFVVFIKLIKSRSHVASCRDIVWFKCILCTLTQQITCLASNKQSKILCFEKKGHFQPHFLTPPLPPFPLFWFIFNIF